MNKKKKLFLIILTIVILIIFFIFMFSFIFKNDDGTVNIFSNKKGFSKNIVKTFLPESHAAFKYASPMLYNNHIYIGTSERTGYDNAPISNINDNYFYKLNLDFDVVWKYALHKKMVTGGAIMDSKHNIYFVVELLNDINNSNQKEQIFTTVYLMSLTEKGKFRWEKQISLSNEFWDHASLTPAISTDDIIYIGHSKFYAFDVNGNILHTYPFNENEFISNYGGAPVIDANGNIYFISPEPTPIIHSEDGYAGGTEVIKAYKFSPRLESLVWSTKLGNEIMDNEGGNPNGGGGQRTRGIESPPALGVQGKSLFGLVGCTINKVDTETGELVWYIKPIGASGHFNASPAIDDKDNLYVGTKSNNESTFYAISSAGKMLWKTLIGSDLYNSPVLTNDNTIYVGSETNPLGKFHVLDMKTGEHLFSLLKDNERKVPDFSHDGMLLYKGYSYIGVHASGEGNEKNVFDPTFYKIKVPASGYLKDAPWPRIFGSNNNSGRIQR